MKFPAKHILRLIDDAASKANTSVDHGGLQKLSDKIEEELFEKKIDGVPIRHRYLYETVWKKTKIAYEEGKTWVKLGKSQIDTIARYLGFEDFDAYLESLEEKKIISEIPPILLNCVGNWYSYVRDGSGKDFLLRSPMRIFREGEEIKAELIGGSRNFYGTVRFRSGGLFFLLSDKEGKKEMHEVYYVGILDEPDEILSGVFSALSSRGTPVAGRKILLRAKNKEFSELEKGKIPLPYTSNDEYWPQNIVDFFEKYEGNYIMASDTRIT